MDDSIDGNTQEAESETVRVVRDIWGDALALEVKDDSDFFELGGDSLAATQIISEVEERLGIRMAFQTLFEQSTLAQFCGAVEARRIE